jgi:hypothetical protein
MYEKKVTNFKTPDLSKLQEVVIDARTKIYVAVGTDPAEAKSRFLTRLGEKNKVHMATRKPVIA